MEGGYIKLYRKIREHWIWQKPEYLKWWLDILLMANHSPAKVLINNKPKIIETGAFHTSETKLSVRWFADRKIVDKFLTLLKNDEMIELNKSRSSGTTIKVRNYRAYQAFFDSGEDNGTDNKKDKEVAKKPQRNGHKQVIQVIQEPNKYKEAKASSSADGGASAESKPIPYSEIMELYNRTCVSLAKIKIIDGERKITVSERFDTYGDIGVFQTLFEKAEASKFLKGENERKWKADFDWLTDADNMTKTLEGKYDRENDPPPKQDGMRVEYETFDLNTFAEKAAKAGMRYDGQEAKPQKN